MKPTLAVCLLLVTGCTTPNSINDLFAGPRQPLPPEYYNPKPTETAETAAPEVCNGKCGYVSTRTYDELPAHNEDCSKKKMKQKDCAEKFFEMLYARFALKYPRADYDKIVVWCKAEPRLCDLSNVTGANALEDEIMSSHNSEIRRQSNAQYNELMQKNHEKDMQRRREISEALAAQNRNKISCQATRYGNTTYTDCK